MLRKRILSESAGRHVAAGEIDVAASSTVSVTSEAVDHPVDNAFDGRGGPGGTSWVAAEPGDQALILAFDAPQAIRRITLEIEEVEVSRRQELEVAASCDGGRTYRTLVRQGYNFSPPGTTFEREEWSVSVEMITQLRLWIRPDQGGMPCRAKLTSLLLR